MLYPNTGEGLAFQERATLWSEALVAGEEGEDGELAVPPQPTMATTAMNEMNRIRAEFL
jgi:hypothetical protein